MKDLIHLVQTNTIKDCPVTVEDIKIAQAIYGQDIGIIKGKTTRSKPPPVVEDYVKIPKTLLRQQRKVDLCADILKINGLYFLARYRRD